MQNKTTIRNSLNSIEKVIGILLVGALFIILSYQVFGRVLNLPMVWTDEAARYLFVMLTYIGAGFAVLVQKHIKIDILIYAWPKPLRPYMELLGSLVSVLFCAFVFYHTVKYNMIIAKSGRIGPTLGISMSIPYAAVNIGYFLMSVRLIQAEVIPKIKALRSGTN